MARCASHDEAMISSTSARLISAYSSEAKSPRALRELMILRGAQIMGADYEWTHHVPMARAAGVAPSGSVAVAAAAAVASSGSVAAAAARASFVHASAIAYERTYADHGYGFDNIADVLSMAPLLAEVLDETRPMGAARAALEAVDVL